MYDVKRNKQYSSHIYHAAILTLFNLIITDCRYGTANFSFLVLAGGRKYYSTIHQNSDGGLMTFKLKLKLNNLKIAGIVNTGKSTACSCRKFHMNIFKDTETKQYQV